jgi:hypothetical protein
MDEYETGPLTPIREPDGIVTEPWGARYEYPRKMSIREAVESAGAAGLEAALGAVLGAVLVES